MNGMGIISTARAVVRLNDSIVMEWLRYDEHCTVIISVDSYKRRRARRTVTRRGIAVVLNWSTPENHQYLDRQI
jgi:hypothetical protein